MNKKDEALESQLAEAVLYVSALLSAGMQLEQAFKRCATKEGKAFEAFSNIAESMEKSNASFQEAVMQASMQYASLYWKRVLSQCVALYEKGDTVKNVQSLRTVARELLSMQKHVIKEFNAKIAMYSMAFIAVSAILPALFQAFIVLGGMFMDFSYTAGEVHAIFNIGFPLLDGILLGVLMKQTPAILKG
jgi:hypothetical protein